VLTPTQNVWLLVFVRGWSFSAVRREVIDRQG